MSYTLRIDHNLKIVSHTHQGIIELEELGNVWREFLNMKEFAQLGYNLLTDYRGCKFNFSIDELDRIGAFLDNIKPILDGKKNAVMVDRPNELALSMLVGHGKEAEMNFEVKIFSTEEAALKFLTKVV